LYRDQVAYSSDAPQPPDNANNSSLE
jgi:hypothetical protein